MEWQGIRFEVVKYLKPDRCRLCYFRGLEGYCITLKDSCKGVYFKVKEV